MWFAAALRGRPCTQLQRRANCCHWRASRNATFGTSLAAFHGRPQSAIAWPFPTAATPSSSGPADKFVGVPCGTVTHVTNIIT